MNRITKYKLVVVAVVVLTVGVLGHADTLYNNQAAFLGALGSQVTDDYSNIGYHPSAGNIFIYSDGTMSGVIGETRYHTTSFNNNNILFNNGSWNYCGGCNGSFVLNFGSTSVSSGGGVYGAGFLTSSFSADAYNLITFSDGATMLVHMPGASSFFGITSNTGIASFHFVRADGSDSNGNDGLYFSIQNLTIGGNGQVPEPASLVLLTSGLLGLGARFGRKPLV